MLDRRSQSFLVRFNEAALFLGAGAGEGVVRRVAEDNEDASLLFDPVSGLAFLAHLRERELQLRRDRLLRLVRRLPAGEGVREVDASALVAVGVEGCAKPTQQKA